jgi:flagellar motility protein MotE (MotC chaperone)
MNTLNKFTMLALFSAVALSCGNEDDKAASTDGGGGPSRDANTAEPQPPKPEVKKEGEGAKVARRDAGADTEPGGATADTFVPENIAGIKVIADELRERRRLIALRERECIRREQLLSDLERAVLEKTAHLERLKKEVADLIGDLRGKYGDVRSKYEEERLKREQERAEAKKEILGEREKRIAHLVATLKGMRAASGAGLLASMDNADAVEVLQQLGPRQAAALLGGMNADQAAHLAESMLGPKDLPADFIKALPTAAEVEAERKDNGDAGVDKTP